MPPENARIVLDCLRHLQGVGRLTLYGFIPLEGAMAWQAAAGHEPPVKVATNNVRSSA